MKGFFNWFRSETKIKRWILLIIVGIILACYGMAKLLIEKQLGFGELAQIILSFIVRIYLCRYCDRLYPKANLRNFSRRNRYKAGK